MKVLKLVYKFHKDGRDYTIIGDNRTSARLGIEISFHVDLSGAKYEETLRNGTVLASGFVR